MAISGISNSIPQTQTAPLRHGSHSRRSKDAGGPSSTSTASSTQSKSSESIEQLAQQGDPTAIAELKQLDAEQTPNGSKPGQETPAAVQQQGANEPGKGDQIDEYA
jgi:hypothetical protein